MEERGREGGKVGEREREGRERERNKSKDIEKDGQTDS